MADFASLHEEADALGDNFMSQMMSSGDLDGTNVDATMTLGNSKTMPDYSPSFLTKRVGNAGDSNDDASSVSSQLSSASSTTASSQKQDDDESSSISIEDASRLTTSVHGGAESSVRSSSDEGDTGGGDSATSASQSSEELVSTDIIHSGKAIPGAKKTKFKSKTMATPLPQRSENPKPKLRLSLKVKTAIAETKKPQNSTKKTTATTKKRKAVESGSKTASTEKNGVQNKQQKVRKPKTDSDNEQALQTDVREKAEKPKGKPGPKPKASALGGSGGTSAVPPKKRKISTPRSKTTAGATGSGGAKGKGKAVKVKNVNKNKGKKGSGAGNASNDAGPGTALEILLPLREKGRYVRGTPMFFYSSKLASDKQAQSSAANRGNGSNPSVQAAALAATTYVPNLKQKLPPFQSPGLLVHPSLGFTASSSNTLSAANLHLEKKVAGNMFRNGLEQIGYIYPTGERKRNRKKSKNGEESVASSQVELLHRGSSTVRGIEDLFDRWITQDEARKMIPKDFLDPIIGTVDDQNNSDLKSDSTICQVFSSALGQYMEEKFTDSTEESDLSDRLPMLPQDFKDMLPQSLISSYAQDETYSKKWEKYAAEVAHRENQIVLFQQAVKQSKKKSNNAEGQSSSGEKGETQDPASVEIPPIPRPPTPPTKMKISDSPYHPAPQEHLLKHLDPKMYGPTTSRYHGLLSSALADPQYVGPNAPGLLGLIHMMSAVGSSANAAAAAAALGTADGSKPGVNRKAASSTKKKSSSGGGGGAPPKKSSATSAKKAEASKKTTDSSKKTTESSKKTSESTKKTADSTKKSADATKKTVKNKIKAS